MKKFTLVFAVMALSAPWTVANAADKSDFALFDGTDSSNTDPGALCGAGRPDKLKRKKAFTYHIAVTNFGSDDGAIKVIYEGDLDFVRYIVRKNTSFSLSQAGGGPGGFDRAIRVDADDGIAGAVSIKGRSQVFCLSCDEDADGDSGCDDLIPN